MVESLARHIASTTRGSLDPGDLAQEGVLGLIDAASRYDESRGVAFAAFAKRRVRGAMMDMLRKQAWPRSVRKQRRELEAAREELREALGCEPSIADLAAKLGRDERRMARTIVRLDSYGPTYSTTDDEAEPITAVAPVHERPDEVYRHIEDRARVRSALRALPARDRKVIGLYYYRDATMKEIGRATGLCEARVSQLHARALRRLRESLEATAA